MKKINFSIGVLFLASSLFAGSVDVLPYLRMGVSARAMGMGGAFTGLSDDVASSHYNPAGLSAVGEKQVSFMTAALSNDRTFNWFAVGIPAGKSAIALSAIASGVGNLYGYDSSGNSTGSFDYKNFAGIFTFSRKISEKVQTGLNVKYLKSDLQDNSASGYGADVGFRFFPSEKLSAGFVLQDLGSSIKWNTQANTRERVSSVVRLGFAYRLLENKFLAAADILKVSDESGQKYNLGLEYLMTPALSARLGSNDGNISAGFGIKVGAFALNYAFLFDNLESNRNRQYVSLDLAFSAPSRGSSYSEKLLEKQKKAEMKAKAKEEKRKLAEQKKAEKMKKKEAARELKKKELMSEYYNKGVNYYQKGKYKKAIKEWEKVLKIDPNHEQSKKSIEKAREKLAK